MQHLILCMFLASIAVLKVSGTTKSVLDFFSYVSADYDNKEQTQQAGDEHAFIQCRVIPVDMECLRPNPVLFIEHAVNGVIRILAVAVVTDGFDDTVSLTIYNFADYTKYKPGEYNVEELSNISCGDLQGDEDCVGSFTVSSKGVVGTFPLCSLAENGKHPRLTLMYTCDFARLTMPMDSPDNPYQFRKLHKYAIRIRQADWYHFINTPKDYVTPCGN